MWLNWETTCYELHDIVSLSVLNLLLAVPFWYPLVIISEQKSGTIPCPRVLCPISRLSERRWPLWGGPWDVSSAASLPRSGLPALLETFCTGLPVVRELLSTSTFSSQLLPNFTCWEKIIVLTRQSQTRNHGKTEEGRREGKKAGGKERANFRKCARSGKILAQTCSQGLSVRQREDGGNAAAPVP